jgi:hypothetical protein
LAGGRQLSFLNRLVKLAAMVNTVAAAANHNKPQVKKILPAQSLLLAQIGGKIHYTQIKL